MHNKDDNTNHSQRPPELFKHQVEGIAYLRGEGDKALFDEPGLGKTRQLIEAISLDIDDGFVRGALVVCPNILKSTWEKEVRKYSKFTPAVFGNDVSGRKQAYLHLRPSFYIINYEAVNAELSNLLRLLKFRPLALILDESQRIKNPEAKVTKSILELRDHAKKRIIVTGTPVANKPEDVWSQFFFLDGGQLLGDSYNDFKSQYSNRDESHSLAQLQEMLSTAGIRRRKNEVLDLPEKQFVDHKVVMSEVQSVMYQSLREELILWVKTLSGDEVIQNAENILTRMLRLAQIASNPRLIDAGYEEVPAKFKALDEIVDSLMKENTQKIIIWSSFVPNIFELTERYSQYNAVPICGGINNEDRDTYLHEFIHNPEVKILIANPAAAREGLTLTVANVAIYLDRTFNLVDYLQSQDRIHRISQTKDCTIINLMAEGTIDEYISFTLETKRQTAEYLQGDQEVLPGDVEHTRAELLRALL